MKPFSYTGLLNSKKTSGQLLATDKKQALKMLLSKGIKNVKVRRKLINLDFGGKLKNKDIISFFSSIAAMDTVGIDILKAMKLMKDDIAVTKKLKTVSTRIFNNINDGDSFSMACQKSSASFTSDLVGLISIAEGTGRFSFVFEKIIDYLKWNYDIKQKTKKAIRGPLVTLGLMITMIIVMSVTTLPKITEFLDYFNMEPPVYTVALIKFASAVTNYWKYAIGGCFLLWIVFKIFGIIFAPLAISIDRIKLFFPVFGNLILKLDTSRFISFFQLMYDSGADMLDILVNVSEVVKNQYVASRIRIIHKEVLNGSTVFKSLDKQLIFPIMFRKMMAICEATGEVGPVLQNVKYFYDKETAETVEKMVGTIKPVMTIILGGMLIWMGGSMLGPIYSNIGNLGEQ